MKARKGQGNIQENSGRQDARRKRIENPLILRKAGVMNAQGRGADFQQHRQGFHVAEQPARLDVRENSEDWRDEFLTQLRYYS